MKRILIGTPVRGEVTPEYMQGILELLTHTDEFPNTTFEIAMISGPSVNFARNTLVINARGMKCDELMFIDADMMWNVGHLKMILNADSKRYPVLAGLYTKRKFLPQWLFNEHPEHGLNADENNILQVNDVATGFMRIKMDVFAKIALAHPELEYDYEDDNDGPGVRRSVGHDFFSMGVFDRVLHGEDYYFCKRCRDVGVPVSLHMGCLVPHVGRCAFPLDPEKVIKLAKIIETTDITKK